MPRDALAVFLISIHIGIKILITYQFESEFSQMIEMESPKKWVVFMERRIWRCIRLKLPTHRHFGNMLDFFSCSSHIESSAKQCYDIYMFKRSMYLIKAGNSLSLHSEFPPGLVKCPAMFHKRIQIYLHKMFFMNLTFTSFSLKAKTHMQPFNLNCQGLQNRLYLSYNNFTNVFCGKRFPWSVYASSHSAILSLPYGGYNEIDMQVNLVDRHIMNNQDGSYAGELIKWGAFAVHTYRVHVEMLYRLHVVVDLQLPQTSYIHIHNGPASSIARIFAYKNISSKAFYRLSTFQAFIVAVTQTNIEGFHLIYKPDPISISKTLMTSERIHIKNNSGCGNTDTKSWMCTLAIVSLKYTHARVRILFRNFDGPFNDMFISAGIAVYNIVKNNTQLVAHFYTKKSDHLQRSLAITGTENKLLLSLYAYFPFTILSCNIIAETSPCVGWFIGWHKRPSIAMMPHSVTKIPFKDLDPRAVVYKFVVHVIITPPCFVIHIIFTPSEYIQYYIVSIIFYYNNMLSVHLESSIPVYHWESWRCHHPITHGDFSYTYFDPGHRSYKLIGKVDKIDVEMWTCGNRAFTMLSVSTIPCMYPCRHIYKMAAGEQVTNRCDICTYRWLTVAQNQLRYSTSTNCTLIMERIKGKLFQEIILSIPSSNVTSAEDIISYKVPKLTYRFRERRVMQINLTDEQVWRASRECLRFLDPLQWIEEIFDRRHYINTRLTIRNGRYEYFVLTINVRSWSDGEVECRKKGGHLLTAHDIDELHFILNNIMKPLNIERVFIGMTRVVSG